MENHNQLYSASIFIHTSNYFLAVDSSEQFAENTIYRRNKMLTVYTFTSLVENRIFKYNI